MVGNESFFFLVSKKLIHFFLVSQNLIVIGLSFILLL